MNFAIVNLRNNIIINDINELRSGISYRQIPVILLSGPFYF